MNSWWESRRPREQKNIAIAAVIILAFALYAVFIKPMNHSLSQLKNEVNATTSLHVWLKLQHDRYQRIHSPTHSTRKKPLLTHVVDSLENDPAMKNYAHDLQQSQDNQIKLYFSNVNFDELIGWMHRLWKNNSIEVKQAQINRLNNEGDVTAQLILQFSN